ncbi:unnamed protein product [Rotaria magnacalcarata]|uniref:Uncharacterized protein n=1 Tax=Rotaria magnacalcarata TaxID=392030 RepID=A0A816YWL0_9BILA|nr:unnamed protein product [Rotaria magnacalcarata]
MYTKYLLLIFESNFDMINKTFTSENLIQCLTIVDIELSNILLLATLTEKHLALLERTLVLASIRTKSVRHNSSINSVHYQIYFPLCSSSYNKSITSSAAANNNTTSSRKIQTIDMLFDVI